ncbi:MAG: tRNA pseudouridine(55) synthase TruB, partial [Acidimicrobiia bacterium]
MTTGFLVVDKPSGITSHDVVDEVRRATGIRKAGHTGTLDPLATGVVVVAVGGVTRLIRFLQDLDKEYVAAARFGVATDTLDADGAVTDEVPMDVTIDDLESVRSQFVGEIQQIPPMVSAL